MAIGPNLGLPDPILLQHFNLGLNPIAATFLNSTSGGSFNHLTPSEGRKILEEIVGDTPYTEIYDEFPEDEEPEQEEPTCSNAQSINSPELPNSNTSREPKL